MAKIIKRSKSKFPSIHKAWRDAGRKTGIKPKQVQRIEKSNRKFWVWKVRKKRCN